MKNARTCPIVVAILFLGSFGALAQTGQGQKPPALTSANWPALKGGGEVLVSALAAARQSERLTFYDWYFSPERVNGDTVRPVCDAMAADLGSGTANAASAQSLFKKVIAFVQKYSGFWYLDFRYDFASSLIDPLLSSKDTWYSEYFWTKGPWPAGENAALFLPDLNEGAYANWEKIKVKALSTMNGAQRGAVAGWLCQPGSPQFIGHRPEILAEFNGIFDGNKGWEGIYEFCRAVPVKFDSVDFWKTLAPSDWQRFLLVRLLSAQNLDREPSAMPWGPITAPADWEKSLRALALQAAGSKEIGPNPLLPRLIEAADVLVKHGADILKADRALDNIESIDIGIVGDAEKPAASESEQEKQNAVSSLGAADQAVGWFNCWLAHAPLSVLSPAWRGIWELKDRPSYLLLALDLAGRARGDAWIAGACDVLARKDGRLSGPALRSLSRMGAKDAVANMIAVIMLLPASVQKQAAPLLVSLSDAKMVGLAIQCAKEGPVDVRLQAIRALGKIRDTRAIDVLSSILTASFEPEEIKSLSAWALGRIDDNRSTQTFITLLMAPANRDTGARIQAAYYLGNKAVASAQNALLLNIDPLRQSQLNAACIEALGFINQEAGLSRLALLLPKAVIWVNDGDYGTPFRVLWALYHAKRPETLAFSRAVLQSKDAPPLDKSLSAAYLRKYATPPDPEWTKAVESGLENISDEFVPMLSTLVSKENESEILKTLVADLGSASASAQTWILSAMVVRYGPWMLDPVLPLITPDGDMHVLRWCYHLCRLAAERSRTLPDSERTDIVGRLHGALDRKDLPDDAWLRSARTLLDEIAPRSP